MRTSSCLMALAFLLVAIAAGMWPSWALASASVSWNKAGTVAEQASPTLGPSAFRPCYSTVRTASISCFPQFGLPDGQDGNRADASRHCMPATEAHAMKSTLREAEFRPPRSFVAS